MMMISFAQFSSCNDMQFEKGAGNIMRIRLNFVTQLKMWLEGIGIGTHSLMVCSTMNFSLAVLGTNRKLSFFPKFKILYFLNLVVQSSVYYQFISYLISSKPCRERQRDILLADAFEMS